MNYISIFQNIKDSISQCMNLGNLDDTVTQVDDTVTQVTDTVTQVDDTVTQVTDTVTQVTDTVTQVTDTVTQVTDTVTQDEIDKVNGVFDSVRDSDIKIILSILGINKDLMSYTKAGVHNKELFDEFVVEIRRLDNSDKFMKCIFDNSKKIVDKMMTEVNKEEDDKDDIDSIVFESDSDYDDFYHRIATLLFTNNGITVDHDPYSIVTLMFGNMITLIPGDYTIEIRSTEFDDATELILMSDGYEFEMDKEYVHNTITFTYGIKVNEYFTFGIKRLNSKVLEDIHVGVIEVVKHEEIDL